MQNNQNTSRKRDNFRLQIRRKHVENIFSERRKQFAQSSLSKGQYDPANQAIMRKCLIRNGLLQQLSQLLPRLSSKIKQNSSPVNVEFVLTISSNILLDSINLEQREYIYCYCARALANKDISISPLVQVYFYEVIFATCYSTLDEIHQIQMQNIFLGKLLSILTNHQIDMRRVPDGYTYQEVRNQVIEGALAALHSFYCQDSDHNIILLYKVKRSLDKIQALILWLSQQIKQISKYSKGFQILLEMNKVFLNISSIQGSFQQIIGQDYFKLAIDIFFSQLSYESEKFQQIKSFAVSFLRNILNDENSSVWQIFHSNHFKLLLNELERSINTTYQTNLINLFTDIVKFYSSTQNKILVSEINELVFNMLSIIGPLIKEKQDKTNISLLISILQLLKCIAGKGFEEGNGDYINYMSNIGINQMLDGLYISVSDQQVQNLLDDIYNYIDLC